MPPPTSHNKDLADPDHTTTGTRGTTDKGDGMTRVRHRACPIDGRIDCMVHVPSRRGRSGAQQRRRAAVVAAWVDAVGQWCPGYGVPAHVVVPPNRLSADHVVARSLGGEHGDLAVLCIECNARRGQG